MNAPATPRRSLIMAGGGLKVAFQAGVLQVWLDEVRALPSGGPLVFNHADGASGGVFNLAMWCQGCSGHEIADNWRAFRPLTGVSLNWRSWFPRPMSLFRYDRFRRRILDKTWALDWQKIRSTGRDATFNLFDFARQHLLVLPAAEMDEDALISAVSLPMWFPPVPREDGLYIDAVYATDANLDTALDRGADELWIIWTVSQRGTWRPGFVDEYFQIIEAAANSRIRAGLDRIDRNNREVERGGGGEFGRFIKVRWLSAEVPAHYLFNFTRSGMRDAVDRGVAAARSWVRDEPDLILDQPSPSSREPASCSRRLRFTERMTGSFGYGQSDCLAGADVGYALDNRLGVRLRVDIDDLAGFVVDPDHAARLSGVVISSSLGGTRRVDDGELLLLTDDGDFRRKQMIYRIHFSDGLDRPLTLLGRKFVVHDDGVDVWSDTTTLYTRIFRGHVRQEAADELVGSGILRISQLGVLRLLTSFRPPADNPAVVISFFGFFLRQLWQVYGGRPDPVTQPPGLSMYEPSVARVP